MAHTEKPTQPQLALLRALASRSGRSFAWPETRGEASREIERMTGRRRGGRGPEAGATERQLAHIGELAHEVGEEARIPAGAGLSRAEASEEIRRLRQYRPGQDEGRTADPDEEVEGGNEREPNPCNPYHQTEPRMGENAHIEPPTERQLEAIRRLGDRVGGPVPAPSSKAEAGEAIDGLIAAARKAGRERPATPAQLRYLSHLARELGTAVPAAATQRAASRAIEALRDRRQAERAGQERLR